MEKFVVSKELCRVDVSAESSTMEIHSVSGEIVSATIFEGCLSLLFLIFIQYAISRWVCFGQ